MPQVPLAPHPILCSLLLLSHISDPLSNVMPVQLPLQVQEGSALHC